MTIGRGWTCALMALAFTACGEGDLPTDDPVESAHAELEITPTAGAPWVAKHGLTAAQYQREFAKWVDRGYRLTYASGYAVGNEERFAALFEKPNSPCPPWVARHGMTSAQYQAEFNRLTSKGFRLVLVNGYAVNNVDKYVAIWQRTPGPAFIARHRLTNAQYQGEVTAHAGNGFRLEHVSGYVVNGADLYAAIWTKSSGPTQFARHGMTDAQYQAEFTARAASGFQLMDVSGYSINGADSYAAIWEQRTDRPWIARHGLTASQYQAAFEDLKVQGYRPVLVAGYGGSGGEHYAAIWKNFVYTQAELDTLDAPATTLLSARALPSISYAITRGGRLVYAKGFGLAIQPSITDTATPATTASRYRIMSVSKSITAVAIMRMLEKGLFTLESKVFGATGVLGTDFASTFNTNVTQISVRNLLNHAAGGWGRNTSGTNSGGTFCNEPTLFTPTATLLTDVVKNTLRDCPLEQSGGVTRTPGTSYDYANFGYTLLGRIIEKKGGTSYESWVRNNVMSRMGITQMVLAGSTKADRQTNEVVYYDAGNANRPYSYNVPRMDAHGGWLGTPIELARFATFVDGKGAPRDIFINRPATFNSMVSRTNLPEEPRYAKGWLNEGSTPNVIWHDGSLDGTTAILMMTSDAFTMAALSNTRDNLNTGDLFTLMNTIKSSAVSWSTVDLSQ